MKCKFFSVAFLCLLSFSLKANLLEYTITPHPYRFSTYYEMLGKKQYEGKVIKPSISVRTCYELYDNKGTYKGQGICRAISMGALYAWAREIDVYDDSGKKIGLIQGKLCTTTHARFDIYDHQDHLIAIAYLDDDSSGFNVVDGTTSEKPLCLLKRKFVDKRVDSWNVTAYEPDVFDVRILKIFSAFALDHQNYFKADT